MCSAVPGPQGREASGIHLDFRVNVWVCARTKLNDYSLGENLLHVNTCI